MSRDGTLLVSGSFDKTLKVWHVKTGRLLKTLTGHYQKIYCTALSWDGKLIASGSADKRIKIWEVRTGKLLYSLGGLFSGHTDSVTGVAFSQDGHSLVSTSLDKTVRLWQLLSGKELVVCKKSSEPILLLSMSWNGCVFVYGGQDSLLRIRQVKTGKLIKSIKKERGSLLSIAIDGQGTSMATSRSKQITLSNFTNQETYRLEGYNDVVNSLAFNADGQRLVSGGQDGTVRLWNLSTQENTKTLVEHQSSVYAVVYSPIDNLIASGSADKTIKIWKEL
ncbi:MAG: WD40 repeat domain-containing protein [Leptolyngbyaceae cyanobacterium RM1_1_2]|nr:WD40 repeat domain-containing protein [Leptolyngbyaceae cyanobacterium RM1_1_2]